MRLSLGLGLSGGGSSGSAVRPLRAVATRSEANTNSNATTSANNLRICRSRHYWGDVNVTEVRVVMAGYYAPLSFYDANIGNNQTCSVSLEYNSTTVPFTFSGSATGTIIDGTAEYISDPIYPAAFGLSVFTANDAFWIRDERTVTAGQKIPTTSQNAGASNNDPVTTTLTAASGTTSLVNGTGNLVAGGAWTSVGGAIMPCCIIGRTTGPAVSIMMVGDSIVSGDNDVYGDGGPGSSGGFVKRGLNGGARKITFTNVSTQGTAAKDFFTNGSKKMALFKYHTHVVCEYITNDFSGGQTLADCQTNMQAIWSTAKTAGCYVAQTKMLPRCNAPGGSSTDSFRTAVNQTVTTGCETGGVFRDPWNAFVAASVGSTIDEYMSSLSGAVQDATFPDKWKSNGAFGTWTVDGLHPAFQGHVDMSSLFRAIAYAYTGS